LFDKDGGEMGGWAVMNQMVRLRLMLFSLLAVAAAGMVACFGMSYGNTEERSDGIPPDALKALLHADVIVLHSTLPNPILPHDDEARAVIEPLLKRGPDGTFLRNGTLYGSVELSAPERSEVAAAFRDVASNPDGGIAMCFWPRHELEVTYKDQTWTFTICFECSQAYINRPHGGKTAHVLLNRDNKTEQAVFDRVLDRHGVLRDGTAPKIERKPVPEPKPVEILENGDRWYGQFDPEGRKTGTWVLRDKRDWMKVYGEYLDGKKHGWWETYDPDNGFKVSDKWLYEKGEKVRQGIPTG
jgi:hypothetical protein